MTSTRIRRTGTKSRAHSSYWFQLNLFGLALLLFLGLHAMPFAAETKISDFSGRWDLDKSASQVPVPSPDRLIIIITPTEDGLKVVSDCQPSLSSSPISLLLVPVVVPVQVLRIGKRDKTVRRNGFQFESTSQWQGNRLITTWRLSGQGNSISGHAERSLSPDGSIQTISIDAQSRTEHRTAMLIFRKR